MSNYRIVLQYEQADGSYTEGKAIHAGSIHHPSTILQLGLRHSTQIEIIRKLQTALLNHQSVDLQEAIEYCPKCGYEVIRNGSINIWSVNMILCSLLISTKDIFFPMRLPIITCDGCS